MSSCQQSPPVGVRQCILIQCGRSAANINAAYACGNTASNGRTIYLSVGNSTIRIEIPSGLDISALQGEIDRALTPSEADLLWAGNVVKTGILQRTEQGVDYQGRAFHPYSTKGPYYWYPASVKGHVRGHQSRLREKKSSSPALHEILHAQEQKRGEQMRAATHRVFKKLTKAYGGITTGLFHLTRNRMGIKFESYAAAKTAFGRVHVDLTGLDGAPHMLQQVEVRVAGHTGVVGIWDEFAASKAEGHNEGNPKTNLPRRQFFEASDRDVETITTELAERLQSRVQKIFGT